MTKTQPTHMTSVVWKQWKTAFLPNRWKIAVTLIASMLSTYVSIIYQPSLVKDIIDGLTFGVFSYQLFYLFVGGLLLSWILQRVWGYFIMLTEADIIERLSARALYGLLTKNTSFYSSHFVGTLISRSGKFAKQTESFIDTVVFELAPTCINVVCVVVYSCIHFGVLGYVMLGWVAVFVCLAVLTSKKRRLYAYQASEDDSRTTGVLSDILSSVQHIRTFSQEQVEYNRYKQFLATERTSRLKKWFFSEFVSSYQGLLIVVLQCVVMYVMIERIQNGLTTVGTLAMLQIYILSLSRNMRDSNNIIKRLQTAFSESFEMAQILQDTSTATEVVKEPVPVSLRSYDIRFDSVSFGYRETRPIVSDLSFRFESGKRYGIVGMSGAGKTTLCKLIMRQVDPQRGTISIGGISVLDFDKPTLRSLISFVSQVSAFPSRTIRELLSFADRNATEQEMRDVCQMTECQFVWQKFASGFDSFVGERGVKLSGGEMQRLAIASALLKDAPIVLMDEPTSALDAKTEYMIQNTLKHRLHNKTVIVIAHRLSTVAVLDEILFMENGEILHALPHDELLEVCPKYRELWRLQTAPQVSTV